MDFEYDQEALQKTFLAEAEDNLSAMEDGLLALEGRPQDPELIHTVFRLAHSLKGDAGCAGIHHVRDFAHVLEDLLDGVRHGTLPVTAGLISTLLRASDTLRAMIAGAAAGRRELTPAEEDVLSELRDCTGGAASVAVSDPDAIGPRHEPSGGAGRTLRVDTARLDQMLDLTGEIAISRGRLRQVLESLPEAAARPALESFFDAERMFLDLQELVMRARMVPVGPYFRQQARVVRDLANASGRKAALVVEGADAEIDNTLFEQMRQPLTHMLRNALHHGIETPDERIAAGKNPAGRVTLRAYQEAGTIVIQVADDGRGIDREALLARAIATGQVGEGEKLDDREILDLVFLPGISTAKEVTEAAGRGVGMDVVRRNVEQLHGVVQIASREGEGTTVTTRLPLTLAIIDGFGVGVAGERYIVPREFIVECIELPPDTRERDGAGVINLRDHVLPYVRLSSMFGLRAPRGRRENVVVVEAGGSRAGIVVDRLEGDLQIVVKPLGKLFGAVRMVAGSAILGDGRVALIIDVPSFIQQVLRRERSHEPFAGPAIAAGIHRTSGVIDAH